MTTPDQKLKAWLKARIEKERPGDRAIRSELVKLEKSL
jgi:hypothetical protein